MNWPQNVSNVFESDSCGLYLYCLLVEMSRAHLLDLSHSHLHSDHGQSNSGESLLNTRVILRSNNPFQPEEEPPLILLWNRYHKTGSGVYRTIFHRITEGQCEVDLDTDLKTQFSFLIPLRLGVV